MLSSNPQANRFWEFVDKTPGGCWEWTGSRLRSGYGSLWNPNTKTKIVAHRFIWQKRRGPIPRGMLICHHCDNPPCVRLGHLFLGTYGDNMQDCAAKGRLGGTFSPGEASPNVKLTGEQVREIRRLYGVEYQKDTAPRFGVTKKTIGRIQRGESWAAL